MTQELTYKQLKRYCDPELIPFDDAVGSDGIIGQERAAAALSFGMGIKSYGYNIFVSGIPGTGKTTFSKKFAEEAAAKEPTPPDLCYIYNFSSPQYPKLLTLPGGCGVKFRNSMDELVETLLAEIPKAFSAKDFEDKKNSIIKIYQDKRDAVIKIITGQAREQNFGVKLTNQGIYFMPIVNGEIISEEQYDELLEDEKRSISLKSDVIQTRAMEVMREIRDYDRSTRREIEAAEYSVALFTLGYHITKLSAEYADNAGVLEYLSDLKEDILDNIGDFVSVDQDAEEASQNMPWASKRNQEDILCKYRVNVLTDNGGQPGAPVITGVKPTYTNLIGEVEYDSEFGNFTTDFMKIKPGLFHKANGGYLILNVQDVLTTPHVWETLCKIIKTRELIIEPLREYNTTVAVAGIKPEPVNIEFKLILTGSEFYYDLLANYDDDFLKLFKIHAMFDYEMDYSEKNTAATVSFIKRKTGENGLIRFDSSAAAALIEQSTRIAERQDKLTACFDLIAEIISEAAAWAKMDGREAVTSFYVEKAVKEREYRLNIYEEKLSGLIEDGVIMIDTTGFKTAQINGLAVIGSGGYVFAKPSKITATTYVGKAGIVNIEKEAEMSGAIHDKGVQVIIGYLGQMYAQDFPLSLSCRVCFEQNYSGIDGDSASSTELYAILSSLADIPLNQEVAVTGSINQRGEIQPIGGVTYKVEGFFDLCNKRGLTGGQGVIIPAQNAVDLTLNDGVIEAVKAGMFHIYTIRHINEGIEILTGLDAGERNGKGKYPADSIHGRVLRKLKDFYKKSLAED